MPAQLRVNQDEPMEDYPLKVEGGKEDDSRRFGMGQTTKDQMRTNVINEIISTERDYIKHLKDICEVRNKGGRDWKNLSEGWWIMSHSCPERDPEQVPFLKMRLYFHQFC